MRRLKRLLKWAAVGVTGLLALAVAGLFVAYWMDDNGCEQQLAGKPKEPMRAIIHCEFGGPETLRVAEIEKPAPGDDQVLVKVRAAGLNPLDMHFLHGTPYLMRLTGAGLRQPKLTQFGVDLSGVVEAVGQSVKRFRPGDEVFGGVLEMGSAAEYVVATEARLAKKPANVSFEEAGGVHIAARTALQALREYGKLQPGQKVLINGASGGVGTFAVQIAKHIGAEVTGVSSGRNVELVRSLGADHAIDYTQQDYTRGSERYDLIVDNIGNHGFSANRKVLKPTGRYIMIGAPKGRWVSPIDTVGALWIYSKFVDQEFKFMLTQGQAEDLEYIADLMQQGKLKTVIDRTYSLSEAGAAMRHLETGRARGKIVLVIE